MEPSSRSFCGWDEKALHPGRFLPQSRGAEKVAATAVQGDGGDFPLPNGRKVFLAIVLGLLLLSGCFGSSSPRFTVFVDPDPIELIFGDQAMQLHVKVSVSGVGWVNIEELIMEFFDDQGKEIEEMRRVEPIFASGPAVPGIPPRETNQTIQLSSALQELMREDERIYEEQLAGKVYTLVLSITGSAPTRKETEVLFL